MQSAIQHAPFSVFLAMVVVPLFMAAVAVIAGLSARRQAGAVRDTQATPIEEADEGYRQIRGSVVVVEGENLVAPLTGTACCWYSISVEQWRRPLQNTHRKNEWVTIRSEASTAPLLVRDDTGLCLVRLHGADITPADRSQWTGSTIEPVDRDPPRASPGTPLHGMVQVNGLPGKEFRYREERIYAGDPLVVTGVLSRRRDDEEEEDLTQAELLTKIEIAKGAGRQPLVITTVSPAAHVAMNEMGSQAAFTLALVPLAVAAFIVLVRFN